MLEVPDMRLFGRSDQLHLAYASIFEFQKNHARLPENNANDKAAILEIAKKLNEANKSSEGINVEELDEKVIVNTAIFSQNQITPIDAMFGGIIAQEIVKYTGKYSPLK